VAFCIIFSSSVSYLFHGSWLYECLTYDVESCEQWQDKVCSVMLQCWHLSVVSVRVVGYLITFYWLHWLSCTVTCSELETTGKEIVMVCWGIYQYILRKTMKSLSQDIQFPILRFKVSTSCIKFMCKIMNINLLVHWPLHLTNVSRPWRDFIHSFRIFLMFLSKGRTE